MEPLYDLYYLFEKILKRVQDPNATRAEKQTPKNQWIWPEIPTGTDDEYPRLTIQFLNLEKKSISAGSYISDNLKSDDAVKKVVKGNLYNVTMWIGLFVKTELKYNVARPDGQVISAKNGLLGNLLFSSILKEINKAENEIREVAFVYKPDDNVTELNYEDDSKRIINSIAITIPVMSETEITYNADELIETIKQNYSVNQPS